MVKLFYISLILFFINACKMNQEIKSISNKVVNVSNKVVGVIKADKQEKPKPNENVTKSKSSVNQNQKEKINFPFIEWSCDTFFGNTAVLKIGYFPDTKKDDDYSLGALTLETDNDIKPAVHRINGIEDKFSWGGEGLSKYVLIIKPNNTAYYYDFTDAKSGELRDSKDMLKCERNKFSLTKDEIKGYFTSFIGYAKKYGFDIPRFLQN